jgi:hypothetical protein
MPGERIEPHRMIGRDRVEPLACKRRPGPRRFAKLALDPSSFRRRLHLLAQRAAKLLERRIERHVESIRRRRNRNVRMRIVEPGHDGPPSGIDTPRRCAGERRNRRAVSDGDDALTADREGLRPWLRSIGREHFAVDDDRVRRGGAGAANRGGDADQAGDASQDHARGQKEK